MPEAFLLMSADALDQKFRQHAIGLSDTHNGDPGELTVDELAVRRPYRGVQIKKDIYSTLSIVDGNSKPIPLVSESSRAPGTGKGQVNEYADFIISRIEDQRMEKQQIIETFGDSFIFLFGERPRMITFSGMLVNSEDFNWRSQFWHNYDMYLRGTKLVQRNARAFLCYDSIVVEGYPISATATESAEEPHLVPFQMTMFVTNYFDYSRVGNTMFPVTTLPKSLDLMNKDLDTERAKYIPTGAAVREANLNNAPSGNIFSAIREASRAVQGGISSAVGGIASLRSILSGRVMRVPLGVAAAHISERVSLAQGTLPAGANVTDFLNDNRLKMPAAAKFAPVDDSILRTRISANLDEYPYLSESSKAGFSLEQQYAIAATAEASLLESEKNAAMLVLMNLKADKESSALQTAADVVNFAKLGYVLVATSLNIARDNGANAPIIIAAALGVAGLVQGKPNSSASKQALGAAMAKGAAIRGPTGLTSSALQKRTDTQFNTIEQTGVNNSALAKAKLREFDTVPTLGVRNSALTKREASVSTVVPSRGVASSALTKRQSSAFNPASLSRVGSSAVTKRTAVAGTVPARTGIANTALAKRTASSGSSVAGTKVRSSALAKRTATSTSAPPTGPTIPNPARTGRPNRVRSSR